MSHLLQAIRILQGQQPPRGLFPAGGYYPTSQISSSLFSQEATVTMDRTLTTAHTPFPFNLLYGALEPSGSTQVVDNSDEDSNEDEDDTPPPPFEDMTYVKPSDSRLQVQLRNKSVCVLWLYCKMW